jgi:hypothetical protein
MSARKAAYTPFIDQVVLMHRTGAGHLDGQPEGRSLCRVTYGVDATTRYRGRCRHPTSPTRRKGDQSATTFH